MTVFTTPDFASAAAAGKDWRETSIKVLEELEGLQAASGHFNFGFLYISDHLSQDAQSILGLFRSVLKIDNWVGSTGIGICGAGEAFIDKPAIAAMIGRFPADSFCVFPGIDRDEAEARDVLGPWLKTTEPMLVFVHGDPMGDEDPAIALKSLEQFSGGFLTGGLSSSRKEHFQFAGDVFQGSLSGVVFSQHIKVATTLSQGCTPIGTTHVITKCDDHVIHELDNKRAVSIFEGDLRSMAVKKIDRDPNEIMVNQNEMPEEFKTIFKGEVHVAFPVSGSDQNDYLVRNIIGMDPEEGCIILSQNVSVGEKIMFVHRDDETVKQDLSKSLVELRKRVQRSSGDFKPKAAIYVSCVARAFSQTGSSENSELALVREIIGDVPLAGFYAGGEISNARLYGYTGILTLFL